MGEKVYKSMLAHKGFSVIEVLVAFSIFSFIVVGMSSAFILFSRSDVAAGDRNRAVFLAEEGIEAVRSIQDADFANLVDGVWGLSTSSNKWILSGVNDITGIYTRTIEISTVDSNTKKVESRVTWQSGNFPPSTVSLFTQFTDWSKILSAGACLNIDFSNACFDNSNNFQNLDGITLTNSCDFEITANSSMISWNNINQISSLSIDNILRWDENCIWGCTPTGTQNTGTQLNFGNNDLVLSASTTVTIDNLLWNASMESSTIESIVFYMSDMTTASTSAFSPLSCDIFVPDIIAPASISDLAAFGPSQTTIDLSWTAPGDDDYVGTATSYDIRYSTSLIDESNWDLAIQVSGEPTPLISGTSQSMTVTGLSPATTYYFTIKTSDEIPNISGISNVASTSTIATADVIPPASILDLSTSNPTISTILLSWTAPGDDNNIGTAANYDLRYSTDWITESNWALATQVSGEPTPLIAGTTQSMTVSGLNPITTYYFAIKTSDEVPNTSAISNIASGATTASWVTPILDSELDFSGNQDGTKVQIVGDYAYVIRANSSPDFLIINISDTANPVAMGSLSLLGTPKNIYVLGDFAYIASTENTQELQIVNISIPSSPSLVGSYNAVGSADGYGIFVVGTTAYLSRASSGDPEFFTINVGTPATPVLLDTLELAATGYEVLVSGRYAFVASGNNNQELQVIDIFNPANISLSAFLNLASNSDATTISLVDSLLLVGQGTDLRVVDISTPLIPVQVGTIAPVGAVTDIALNYGSGNKYAYISIKTTSGAEFKLIDITTPSSPIIHGSGYNVTGDLNGVAYSPSLDRAVVVGIDIEFFIIKPF